ncbi:MAG: LysE family translocator [Sulfitobacter sp.]|nr:LysE family translocator [Sulfitobacter sp.]
MRLPRCGSDSRPPVTANLLPLAVFVFVGLFSPGPNVLLLTASGVRFGFPATVPHLLGVPVGTGIVAALSATGIGALLVAAPQLKVALQVISSLWILWLAWRMVQSARIPRAADRGRPFTFLEAIAFQAVNPKMWAVTLAAAAGFSGGLSPGSEVLRLFTVFACINLFVCFFWVTVGHFLAPLLRADRAWRLFMTLMAGLMAASVILDFPVKS